MPTVASMGVGGPAGGGGCMTPSSVFPWFSFLVGGWVGGGADTQLPLASLSFSLDNVSVSCDQNHTQGPIPMLTV